MPLGEAMANKGFAVPDAQAVNPVWILQTASK
jgi:hypothetical protein